MSSVRQLTRPPLQPWWPPRAVRFAPDYIAMSSSGRAGPISGPPLCARGHSGGDVHRAPSPPLRHRSRASRRRPGAAGRSMVHGDGDQPSRAGRTRTTVSHRRSRVRVDAIAPAHYHRIRALQSDRERFADEGKGGCRHGELEKAKLNERGQTTTPGTCSSIPRSTRSRRRPVGAAQAPGLDTPEHESPAGTRRCSTSSCSSTRTREKKDVRTEHTEKILGLAAGTRTNTGHPR